MEIIKAQKGKSTGRISVLHTIATMAPEESWSLSHGDVNSDYAAVCCSKYGSLSGKFFTISRSDEGMTIKRIK